MTPHYRTPAQLAADRANPEYVKPAHFDEMVRAAEAATHAARAAGADYDTIKRSAARAAREVDERYLLTTQTPPPVEDPMQERMEREVPVLVPDDDEVPF